MITPLRWMIKRPGLFIPVFFLCLIQGTALAQSSPGGARSLALGNCFVSLGPYASAGGNQAGLGRTENHSLRFQHMRPYFLPELGSSHLALSCKMNPGGIGMELGSSGLDGLRYSDIWISSGLQLQKGFYGGVGLHFWTWSIKEGFFFTPGISFALGLQAIVKENWTLGVHLRHPVSWSKSSEREKQEGMQIAAGFSYLAFDCIHLYSEIHASPRIISLCCGAEWMSERNFGLLAGFSTAPFTLSSGLTFKTGNWNLLICCAFKPESGTLPSTSMLYVP